MIDLNLSPRADCLQAHNVDTQYSATELHSSDRTVIGYTQVQQNYAVITVMVIFDIIHSNSGMEV